MKHLSNLNQDQIYLYDFLARKSTSILPKHGTKIGSKQLVILNDFSINKVTELSKNDHMTIVFFLSCSLLHQLMTRLIHQNIYLIMLYWLHMAMAK